MRVVGVIDVRDGRAVHARGGQRTAYAPIAFAAGERVDGDALALARTYVEVLGARELYLADLDAIHRGVESMNRDIIGAIARLGVPLWVDAGVSSPSDANTVFDAGATTVIIGLETLTAFGVLDEICRKAGGRSVAFSADLRDDKPITLPNVEHSNWSASQLAARAATAGVRSVIVLDLARVGTSAGLDVELLADVRQAAATLELFAGGGVRDRADLDELARVGCDGALVATALLHGAIQLSRL